MDSDNLQNLIKELCKLDRETEWVEFKSGNYDPDMIGSTISALANSSVLHDKDFAYMLWGIDDKTHNVVGTVNTLQTIRKGNEELENWLRGNLSFNCYFDFKKVEIENKIVGVLTIRKPVGGTVLFRDNEYIRIGSYTKKLNEYHGVKAELWRHILMQKYEEQICRSNLTKDEILNLLDYEVYYENMHLPQPQEQCGIIDQMCEEKIIKRQMDGLFSITNLGGLLFAKDIVNFPNIEKRAIRAVKYIGGNKANIEQQIEVKKGYISGIKDLKKFLDIVMPVREKITGIYRQREYGYSEIVLREVIANAIIHQDFSFNAQGPVIEIFNDRIEVTNSGRPLVEIIKIVNAAPMSRNEQLARIMRRMNLCEELGTGWDRIVLVCEDEKNAVPKMYVDGNSTTVVMRCYMQYADMTLEERIWACYMHACVQYANRKLLTNTSLRERFGLPENTVSKISRLIKVAVEEKMIKVFDAKASNKQIKYKPFWA